jgi:hypothetical protein
MNTMNDVRQRLSAARAALVLDHPFFGALALRMALEEETKGRTRTMATDGRSIFYDKAFVKGCSDPELIGLLAHEVMHPAMQHHTRRGDRDPSLWNDAADYAINPILTESGFTLPGHVLNDPQYRGMTAEQIYDALNRPHSGGDEDNGNQDDDRAADSGQENDEGGRNGNSDDDNTDDLGEDADNNVAHKVGAVFDAPDPAQQRRNLEQWRLFSERAQDIGILRFLGASSSYILHLLFQETLLIVAPGTTVGIVMAYGAKWIIAFALSDFMVQETVYKWWPMAGAISAVGALLGASLPAWKAVRQDLVQVLSCKDE